MADSEPAADIIGDETPMTPAQHHQFVTAHLDAASVHLAEAQAHHHAEHAPADDTSDASDAESSPAQDDTSADDGSRSFPGSSQARARRATYAPDSVNARTANALRVQR